jgi:hypothetical protein
VQNSIVLQYVVKYAQDHDLDRQAEVEEVLKPVEQYVVANMGNLSNESNMGKISNESNRIADVETTGLLDEDDLE